MFNQADISSLANAVHGNKLADCQQIVRKCGKDIITAPNTGVPGKPTALHESAIFDRPEILQFFVQQHVNCNVRDSLGTTPLIHAASWGFTECTRLLLTYGADASLRDESGTSALDVARWGGHREIVLLLEGSFSCICLILILLSCSCSPPNLPLLTCQSILSRAVDWFR
eukprot:m.406642 g.406642  ORF g.406642 m.406642 type:complete len:170 (-) comp56498_c3_seq5:126-635(-)